MSSACAGFFPSQIQVSSGDATGYLMHNAPCPDFVYVSGDDSRAVHMSLRRQRCMLVNRCEDVPLVCVPISSSSSEQSAAPVNLSPAFAVLLADAQLLRNRCMLVDH